MARRIVILNGAPRRSGSTAALVNAFADGARGAGCEVQEFHLDSMNIHGCLGCFGGHSASEHPCVQRDDMDKIYAAVRGCDVIVLASPLYYWNLSGQLRTAIDRLFALEEHDGNLLRGHGRGSVLLMTAEGHGFDDVLTYYNHLCEHLSWANLGHVLAGGTHSGPVTADSAKCAEASQLGASMAQTAQRSAHQNRPITSPDNTPQRYSRPRLQAGLLAALLRWAAAILAS